MAEDGVAPSCPPGETWKVMFEMAFEQRGGRVTVSSDTGRVVAEHEIDMTRDCEQKTVSAAAWLRRQLSANG
eukprot:gene21200-57612_t